MNLSSWEQDPPVGARPLGEGPRLPFTCPSCAQGGWVDWKNLNRALRCPKCTCRFLIDRDGQLRSFHDSEQVHFLCARCGKSGRIPAILVPRGVLCPGCKLPLSTGLENSARREETADPARTTAPYGPSKGEAQTRSTWTSSGGAVRAGRWIGTAAVVVAVSALALWFFSGGNALDDTAASFTRYCLAGQLDRAAAFVEDDAYQQMEFQRWFLRHFASIQASHRPRGDRARVAAELAAEADSNSPQKAIKLTMSSSFMGERTHRQIWRQRETGWSFDAVATLAEQDQPGTRR